MPSRTRTGRTGARIGGVLVAGLLALTGCGDDAPEPATLDVVGDSITFAAVYGRLDTWRRAGPGLSDDVELAIDATPGASFGDVQAGVTDRAADGDPDVLVVVLGTNDADAAEGQPGWTDDDETAFARLLATPPSSTCVVVVLPATGTGARAETAEGIAVARPRMRQLAEDRDRTVVVDWADVLATDPGILGPDGIHLAMDPADPTRVAIPASDAQGALLWSAVQRCPDPPG